MHTTIPLQVQPLRLLRIVGSLAEFVLVKTRPRSETLVEELGMLISKTRKMVYADASRRVGESFLAWQVLAVLVRGGKRTQTEVSTALAQHPAGVSRLLDDLEKQGYVARSRDSEDRRRVQVEATPRGQRRFRSILPEVVRGVDHALEPLTDDERRVLRDLLRKVVSQDPEYKSPAPNGGGAR
jgi:DNA-binding MarR family transcriptional regulator